MNNTMEINKYFLVLSLIIIFSFSITVSCDNKKSDIKKYSEKLNIEFPEGMELIYSDNHSDLQDYDIISIYKLSLNQKNALLDKLIIDRSKGTLTDNLYWNKCDDFYSYEYIDKSIGLHINVFFVANNDFSTLSIQEIKI